MKKTQTLGAIAILLAAAAVAPAQEAVVWHGFVDAGYAGNFDLRNDSFGSNQVEIDLTREESPGVRLRADLEWVYDGDAWVVAVEQGFVAWRLAFWDAATFTLGKFNAPIGWELPDAPDMQQATHGLLFTYAAPTNLTGAMLAGSLGAALDWKAYAANGWDRDVENNGVKTWGGRLGYTRAGRGGIGISVISGEEDDAQAVPRTVVDVDLTWNPCKRLALGAEFNHGEASVGGEDGDWTGFMVVAHVRANDWLGVTGRFDTLDDPDDLLFATGLPGRHCSYTLAPVFQAGPALRALVELRLDTADQDVFADRDGADRQTTTSAAFTLTHTF